MELIGGKVCCICLLSGEKEDEYFYRRNYTFTDREWHVENESAFSVNRKGT
jgi:hypothetical protein